MLGLLQCHREEQTNKKLHPPRVLGKGKRETGSELRGSVLDFIRDYSIIPGKGEKHFRFWQLLELPLFVDMLCSRACCKRFACLLFILLSIESSV
jgi:hypothetical protein